MSEPAFFVRELPIYGDVILSPMAGYSDVPCRAISRAYGSSMGYTEFAAADALVTNEWNTQWRRLDHPLDEHPIVFQIFGNRADKLLEAAQKIEQWGPDIIDINMGCSAPKVSDVGSGVGMMCQPQLVAETFRLLTNHLSVPVTGKIRLGWETRARNFIEIAKIMEDNGASLVAMHGRTKVQKYKGIADWDAIGELKAAVSIPVIGNGDVKTPEDVERMKAYTGCDGVMVGRAAIGNPFIFSRLERSSVSIAEITAAVRIHLKESLAYYGHPDGMNLLTRYLKRYFFGRPVKRFIQEMTACTDLDRFEELLQQIESELSQ